MGGFSQEPRSLPNVVVGDGDTFFFGLGVTVKGQEGYWGTCPFGLISDACAFSIAAIAHCLSLSISRDSTRLEAVGGSCVHLFSHSLLLSLAGEYRISTWALAALVFFLFVHTLLCF